MTKPLWIFFNMLREKSSQPLSVDQYFDFFAAFNELKLNHINSMESLRDFCKLFWLNNDSFEEEFNELFEHYISALELEKLILHHEESDTSDTGNTSGNVTSGQTNVSDQRGKTETDIGGEISPTQEKKQSVSSEKEADLKLLIGDGKSNVRSSKRSYLSHQFKLDDQYIMPFTPRHLTQRMRRLVENPKIEWTDELDYKVMIEKFSQNRFIEEILFIKKEARYSHIVLLADHWGSMLAYEYLEEQISNSLQAIPGCRFEQYRFNNLPEFDQETNGYRMLKSGVDEIETESYLDWDKNTWVFLFSDGGGLSRMFNRGRMYASFQFWQYLKSKTSHVHWINPIPDKYRKGTTAERLNLTIPMLFPTAYEFNIFFNKV